MNSQENSYGLPRTGSKRIRKLQAKRVERLEQAVDVSKKVVGYVRVSTEEQATKGHGIESQQRAIKAFAESQGYDLLEIIADAGVSGAKRPADRDGFRRILGLAEARAFSVLLVWKFDRLARNLVYSVITVNELKEKYGVVLRSVTEPIDTASPIGEMIFAVLAGFAAEERRVIIRRTLAGKREKASLGGFSGGAAPLGYGRDREGGLMVLDAESAVVLRIFDMRRVGLSLMSIARKLNDEGVSSKRGGKWYPATIRYMLDNPKYHGWIEYFFRWEEEVHFLKEGSHHAILPKVA
jgi:site-specific DNA recombinase